MALFKVNAIVEYVAYKLKPVLEETVTKTVPGIQVYKDELWKEFLRIVNRKCSIWAKVPDTYIKK